MQLTRISDEVEESNVKIIRLPNVNWQRSQQKKFWCDYTSLKQRMAIADNQEIHLIPREKIIFIKSDSNYSSIYLNSGEILFTSKTLKDWQRKIDHSFFIRCHNSFLINRIHVERISLKTSKLYIGKHEIPISRACKKCLINKF